MSSWLGMVGSTSMQGYKDVGEEQYEKDSAIYVLEI